MKALFWLPILIGIFLVAPTNASVSEQIQKKASSSSHIIVADYCSQTYSRNDEIRKCRESQERWEHRGEKAKEVWEKTKEKSKELGGKVKNWGQGAVKGFKGGWQKR